MKTTIPIFKVKYGTLIYIHYNHFASNKSSNKFLYCRTAKKSHVCSSYSGKNMNNLPDSFKNKFALFNKKISNNIISNIGVIITCCSVATLIIVIGIHELYTLMKVIM